MLNHRWIIPLIFISLIGLIFPQISWAAEPTEPITVLETSPSHIVLELVVPEFELERATATYQKITLGAGWSQWGDSGAPQLPMWSAGLGLPTQVEPNVEILVQEIETIPNYRAAPVPTWSLDSTDNLVPSYEPDQASYTQNRFLPGRVAEVTEVGLVREQAVGQLRLYPFQYNPVTEELQVYRRLRVKITYPTGLGRTSRTIHSNPAFEQVLQQTLLNYDQLGRPTSGSDDSVTLASPNTAASENVRQTTSPQIKLIVEEAGLYQLTPSDIVTLSATLARSDPRLFKIHYQGTEVASYLEGDGDNRFETGERLIFYAEATATDNFETKQNVYWLSLGTSNGLRMSEANATPSGNSIATSFERTQYFEENNVYWSLPINGEDKDHWYWTESTTASTSDNNYSFDLNDLAAVSATGELRVSLYGANRGFNSQLQVQLYLNGTPLLTEGVQILPGNTDSVITATVSQDLLNADSNTLNIQNISPDSFDSTIYINWFELKYQATYQTNNNRLTFSSPDNSGIDYQITGFTSDNIYLFDIGQVSSPIRLVNGTVSNGEMSFSYSNQSQFIAYDVTALRTPNLVLDEPSSWQATNNGATYVIITADQLYDSLQPLKTYRESQGEIVEIVKVTDIYDEFNGGIKSIQAIRDFLTYAYQNWSPQPVYVLLAGDASNDQKQYQPDSFTDDLPTHYVHIPVWGQTGNDYWFTKVSGNDDYADLIIGRLPLRETYEVEHALEKIEAYEQTPASGDWKSRLVLVGDDGPESEQNDNFREDTEALRLLLPKTTQVITIYDPSKNVRDQFNAGALMVSYAGHGSEGNWGSWANGDGVPFFSTDDISNLSNGLKLPFVTVATCATGYFHGHRGSSSMAEQLIALDNNGAIAVWSASSFSFSGPNEVVHPKLYETIFEGQERRLGAAALAARYGAQISEPNFNNYYEMYNYFGDPAVRLDFEPTFVVEAQTISNTVTMSEVVTFTLRYTVSSNLHANGLVLQNQLPDGLTYLSADPAPTSRVTQTLRWDLGDVAIGNYVALISATVSITEHNDIVANEAILSNANGIISAHTLTRTVQEQPIAGLSLNIPALGQPNETLSFSVNALQGTNLTYIWGFGDIGPGDMGQSVQYAYTENGIYWVTVVVSNEISSQTISQRIQINDGSVPWMSYIPMVVK